MSVTQPTITTKTVTIRVLDVGGSKMTLATFKQIPEVDEEPPTDALGWVNAYDSIWRRMRPWAVWVAANGDLRRSAITELDAERLELGQLYIAT